MSQSLMINNLKLYIFLFYVFHSSIYHSQINVTRFEKDIYISNGSPQISKIISTKDSGYCVFGNIIKPGVVYNILLTKLDKFGNIKWSYSYSLNSDSCVNADDCINTFDNGFIICGSTSKRYSTSGTFFYPFIMKVDSLGNALWSKSYSYSRGVIDKMKQLSDSTIALSLDYYNGVTDVLLLQKLDRIGSVLWSKKVNHIYDIAQKQNNNIQIFSGGTSIYLKEFDANGNDLWEKEYKNSKWYYNAWKMDVNELGETVIVSDLYDSTGATPLYIYGLKTNNNGNIMFSNYYSGNWLYDQTYSGGFTKDCGIMINARLEYNGIQKQGIFKLKSDGVVQWMRIYPLPIFVWSKYIINTPDFGYASLGEAVFGSTVYSRIIKTDINGKTACDIDSIIPVVTTVNPLIVDSIMHPTTFVSITNSNISVLKFTNTASIVSHCSDLIQVDTLKECKTYIKENTLIVSSEFVIPNVFTPNGDNINDYFKINLTNYIDFKIDIYNRWGNMVFESNNPLNSWNGRIYNGTDIVVDGTYYYYITILDKSNNEKKYKGFLTLIR